MTELVRDEIDFSAYMKSTTNTVGAKPSEASIVSMLLNFPGANDACDKLTPECFFEDRLRMLFVEIRRQHALGPYDILTVYDALQGSVDLSELHEISRYNDHGISSLGRHVQRVIDANKSRRLHKISVEIQDLAFDTTPIQDRIDKASSAILELEDKEDFGEWIDAHESAIKHLELIDARESGVNLGLDTGLHDFDELLDGGFQRGNLVVIGARPSMGKSALGLTIGLHMAQRYTVGFVSMEMSRADISDRQAAILGGISISHIKRPGQHTQYDRLVEAVEKSRERKFYVVEQGGLNILQIKAKARSLKRRKGLDVLIVDYIGLMSGLDSKQSRAYQIEEISRGLKTLAKDLDIVVICLAQVNRGAADKGNSPPSLHELRDSGAIEQDADVVTFIHRPIVANPDLGPEFQSYAVLRVAKNRQGRCGDVHMFYIGEQTRFGLWSGLPPSKSQESPKKRGFGNA